MINIRILETPEEMEQVEDLQRIVWPDCETDIVPSHMTLTFAHNGGLVLGAYEGDELHGLLFGFPGIYQTPDGPRPKHCSHQMGVHPGARDNGIGFALKRAQWQYVRQQGIDQITWTYDPLQSRNGHLNIGRLGAVSNVYLPCYYGNMRDGLNEGVDSDRFQVDLWVNTRRVEGCFGSEPHIESTLAEYDAANANHLYHVDNKNGFIRPSGITDDIEGNLLLTEIPSNFNKMKAIDSELARTWRAFTREIFMDCFAAGYLVTDFIYDTSSGLPRCFYVLTNGEATL